MTDRDDIVSRNRASDSTKNRDSCTFCDGKPGMSIHVVDRGDGSRYELPICDDHWEDYVEAVR